MRDSQCLGKQEDEVFVFQYMQKGAVLDGFIKGLETLVQNGEDVLLALALAKFETSLSEYTSHASANGFQNMS